VTAVGALRRNLSLRDLVVYGLLFIGPLANVGVFGVLDARADGAVACVPVSASTPANAARHESMYRSSHSPTELSRSSGDPSDVRVEVAPVTTAAPCRPEPGAGTGVKW